ncbi:hemagglutinin repeat-containing protein [Fusobacterium sp.]|uniref:hemagglutinin repeat-containing protein n=1 Tax=Fusobacterium sp. TaxID=68766 RepID=UPI0025C52CB4|nr:hemagglutinin repeat-containing protein [Fusobacterium sp.]MCI7223185.1 hemagglutinin repeat-containing protein [Fusobacterium sp.]
MKKYLAIIFSCIYCLSFSNNIVVDNHKSTNLKIDKAANGVPLVNIEVPNSKGLSHNVFKEYNVGKEGIILNNALYFETTKLGGIVYGNPNLQANQKQANTILTEINGINKTKLEGFTEIAGKQADYILANPNGIYINGAGFINTGNITLSTGNADNLLNPEKGNIEILGKGLDLKNIDKSDLISRTAKLTAPIYGGGNLNIKLGSESKEKKPELALDARALGSIYAGRVNIIATEEGVGVKSDALIYAEKGDLVIDSKGKVQLKNTQAKENIDIKSKETEIKEKLIAEKGINIKGNTENLGNILSNEDLKIVGNLENHKQVNSNTSINILGNLKNTDELKTINLKVENISNGGEILVLDKIESRSIDNSNKILAENNITAKNIKNLDNGNIATKVLKAEEIKNLGKIVTNTLNATDVTNNKDVVVNENLNTCSLTNLTKANLKASALISDDIRNSGKINSKKISSTFLENEGDIEVETLVLNDIKNAGDISVTKSIDSETLLNNKVGKVETKILTIKEIKNQGTVNAEEIKNEILLTTGKVISKNIKTKEIENTGKLSVKEKITAKSLISLNNGEIATQKLNISKIQNTGTINAEEIDNKNLINKGTIISNILKTEEIKNDNKIVANKNLNADKIINYTSGNISSENTNVREIENLGEIKSRGITSIFVQNSGNIEAQNLVLKDLENSGKVLTTNSISSVTLLNKTNGKVETKDLSTKDIRNQGMINVENIENETLLTTGKVISKNIKTKEIKNTGELGVKEKIMANSLTSTETGEVVARNLDVLEIQNAGAIDTEEIDNKDLVNKGIIISNNLKSKDIKNDNKIIVNKNLNADKILNYISGNINSENTNVRKIENLGRIKSREIKNISLENRGIILAERLNSDNISNKNTLLVTKSLKTKKLENINTAEIYSANLNAEEITNDGSLEALILKGNNIANIGKVLTKDIEMKEIDNKNSFVAINSINSTKIKNNGELKTKELNSKNIENTNSLTSKNISTINVDNSGKILTENLETTKLVNKKDIEISNKLTLKDLINEKGKLSAKDVGTINLENKAELRVNNNLEAEKIKNTDKILVANTLTTKDLINTTKVEAKDITIKENFSNTNKINATNIEILTAKIDNKNGEVLAKNNIKISTPKEKLILDGIYVANNKLDIEANSLVNNVNLENNGSLSLNINDDLVNNNKIKSGNNLNIKVKNLINNNELGAVSSLNIESRSFTNTGTTIFGNNENALKVKSDITNTGYIHSLGNLEISANDITNKGQLASVGDLNIAANNVTNQALLYSSGNLAVKFKENFKNEKADIYTGGDFIAIGSGNFENRLGDITSIGNIKVEAENIRNIGEVTGSHTIAGKVGELESNVDMTSEEVRIQTIKSEELIREFFRKHISNNPSNIKDFVRYDGRKGENDGTGSWTWFWGTNLSRVFIKEIDNLVSNYISEQSTIKADKNIEMNAKNEIENTESNILANKNIKIKTEKLINKNLLKAVEREAEFRRHFEFHEAAMHTAKYQTYYLDGQIYNYNEDKGDVIIKDTITTYVGSDKVSQIIAGGNLVIKAEKIGNGIFSENIKNNIDKKNVNVDSVILNKKSIDEREALNTSNYIFIPDNDLDEKEKFVSTNKDIKKIDKIFNNNKFENENTEVNLGNLDVYNSKNDLIIEKEKINTSGKGLFKLNKIDDFSIKPGFSYLIETNLKFLDKSLYLGSEYFFKQINFSPDRNIRLLGDSFYETRLINKTILEGTGRRYLQDFKSEKEQMKYLYDNGIKAQRDLNLSLGIALTKEQIDKLNKDIIWYVEEEVKGVKVLVPKLYLTKNTLNNLKDKNVSLQAGENLNIVATEVMNTGDFIAQNIDLATTNLINLSLLGAEKASIEANDIKINAEENIDNIGASIKAKYNLGMDAEEISNLSTKRINGSGMNVLSKLENKASINAENIDIKAKNSFVNTGASITAEDKLSIESKDIKINTLEENRYFHIGDSKNFVTIDNKKNVKSEILAENIDIKAENNVNIKASNIVAKEDLSISAGGDIDIVSAADSQYFEEKKSSKRKFGGSKSSHKIDFETQNIASNIVGNNINMESGKDVAILGSNIQTGTEGEANISAQGNITQAGVKEIDYSYSKTSKSRFGGLISKSTTKESMQESAIKSATIAGNKGLVYDSKNDLLLEGVNVVSTGNIKIKGDNVVINPIETESYDKVKTVKKGFGGSVGLTGVTVSYGKDKLSTDITNKTDNSSEITSAQNIDIEASNKINAKAVDIYAKEDINISGDKGVEFTSGTSSQETVVKQSSTRFSTGVRVNSAITDTIETVKNIDKIVDKTGDAYAVLNTASNLVGAIRTGANAVNTVVNNDLKNNGDNASTGLKGISTDPKDYLSISSGISKTKSEAKTYDESVVKSSIEGKDIAIKSKDGSVILEGTDITAKNLDLKAKEDIEIKAADEEHKLSNKFSSSSLSVSATLDATPLSITAAATGARGRGQGTSYVNSEINVEEKLKTESENLTLSGTNIEADKIDIKAKDIVIESKQDVSERKDSSFGGSITVGVGPGGVTLKELSVHGSKGRGEGEWVNKQTSLIARNGGEVVAENKLTNTGAVIASLNEEEKLKVSAKEIEVNHLEDKNKYENKGGGVSVSFDKGKPKVPNVKVSHDKVDKEQINRATAINTEFTINDEEKTAEELGFNTDLEKAQEITKDEEKHLNADLHTDLANKDEREKLKTAGEKLSNVAEALTSSNKTLGNFSERYTQAALAGGMADTIIENQDRLSILEKEAKKDGIIDEDIIKEKAGALLNTLEDTLGKFGYKGKEVKVVITDVVDPNGNTFTSTKENIIVFDREFLATARKDELIERIAHEFGHYTEADNETKSQKAAEYFSGLVMEKVKGVSSKEATDETYARIRNNNNLIIGEEGKKLAENIPMNDREYKGYGISTGFSFVTPKGGAGISVIKGITVDEETGETYITQVLDTSAKWSPSLSLEWGNSFSYYPNINQPEDFNGLSLGGDVGIGPFSGEINLDLDKIKVDSYSFAYSKKFKNIENIAKAHIKKIELKSLNSIKKIELKPLSVIKRLADLEFGVGASLSAGTLLTKIKISDIDTEKLYKLVKEEEYIDKQLNDKSLSKNEINKLKEEKNKNKELQGKLAEKIIKSREVKVIHGDSDSWN